jgi:hypothetical protein
MLAHLAADAVLVVHAGFIAFVVLGGVLVWRVPSLAWLHLPAVAWATFVEATGRICPLTHIENHLRHVAGEAGYGVDFVSHYLLHAIYPAGLTRELQLGLALFVVAINLAVYAGWLLYKRGTPRSAMG